MVYHLGLTREALQQAQFALIPGDPKRVSKIAKSFDPKSCQIGNNREFKTFLGEVFGEPVIVTSTGIGGPSAAIVIEELAQLGIHTFIRVGTTGSIQENIQPGDVIITTGSVRLDGTSINYAPISYPALSNHDVLFALINAAKKLKVPHHIGITASNDSFYPGQERVENSFSKYILKSIKGSIDEWRSLNVLNFEMESSAILTACSALGLRCGCISGVIVNRCYTERIDQTNIEKAESLAIDTAIEAIKTLLKEWHWRSQNQIV